MGPQSHCDALLPELATSRPRKSSKPPATRKWTNPHGMNNHKTHGGIHSQSRSQGTVSKTANSCTTPHQTPQSRPPQPPTTIKTDNSAAEGITTAKVRQKKSNTNRNKTTSVSHNTDKGWIYYLLNVGFPSTDKQKSY